MTVFVFVVVCVCVCGWCSLPESCLSVDREVSLVEMLCSFISVGRVCTFAVFCIHVVV